MKEVHIVISLFGSIYDGAWNEINSVWENIHKAEARIPIIDKEMEYLASIPPPNEDSDEWNTWQEQHDRGKEYINSYVTTRTILE